MTDATYQPKVYKTNGGDKEVVASGGTLDIESGGILALAGTTVTSTATELNALASQGAVAADFAKLHAITESAAQLNRAAVPTGTMVLNKTANYTLALGDNGLVVTCSTDGVVFTLPATVVGYTFTIMNLAAAGAAGISLSPDADDRIVGLGLNTVTDDKDFINTKATAKPGDYITVVADGVNGWFVVSSKGTWAREA